MENPSSTRASTHINLSLSLNHINRFADFLLERFHEVGTKYYELYNERNPDLITLIEEKDKDEVKEALIKDLQIFLRRLSSGSVKEIELLEIERGNFAILPGTEIFIHPMESDFKFTLINNLFYKFLPLYSSKVVDAMEVLKELEEIHLYHKFKLQSIQIDHNHNKLKRERDFAESLINHSTNGILSFNKECVITVWNEVMEKISGIKKEFILGKKLFERFPEYKETDEGKAVSRVLLGEKIFISERAFANNKGYYEANAVPMLGLENEVIGGFILFNDTTHKRIASEKIQESKRNLEKVNNELLLQIKELKKVQDQLTNNEKHLKKTQQLAHMGTWVWEVKANRIIWSEELCEIFGINELLTHATIKTYMARVHPEDRGFVLKRIREAVRSHNSFDYEHRIIHPDGSVRYIHGEGIPEVVEGKLIITGFSQDITLKMKVIETLQSSENRFRALCEKSPDAIFLVDSNKILYCNQAAVAMLGGASKTQVLKHSILDLASDKNSLSDSYLLAENFNKALKGDSLSFESILEKFSGGSFWGEIIFTPIKLEDKDILHVVIRDISVRKQAEADIKIAQQELEKINNELEERIEERTRDLEEINQNLMRVNADMDNFVYSASHDLKSPILNIQGLINELVQFPCYKNGEVRVLIDMMMLCVQKFTRTIQDLTDVTKTLRNESEDIKPVKLEELVNDIKLSIHNLITSAEAEITFDFSGCDSILFSRHSLHSLMFNLINNAIKYRSPKRRPEIFIQAKEEKDFIRLSVADNGLGLKESDKAKIFQMFKRAHNHVEGSGVGLYLVKRIMENAGGRVELKSEVGIGSEFVLFFKKKPLSH